MAGNDAERDSWVARVLGVDVAGAGKRDDGAEDDAVLPLWQDARERVGDEIGRLQAAMRSIDLPVLQRIAETGLNGVTGRLQVGMQVACIEFDRSPSGTRPAAAAKLRTVIAGLRAFLSADRIVPILEDNPLGVDVTLRRTMGDALDAIEARLPA